MMEVCAHCHTMVLPMVDGRCPCCMMLFPGRALTGVLRPQVAELAARRHEIHALEKPLRRAVLLARIVGWIHLGFGVLMLCVALLMARGDTRFRSAAVGVMVAAFCFVGPGIAYIVMAGFLQALRQWAVTVLMTISGLIALFTIKSIADRPTPGLAAIELLELGLQVLMLVNLVRCYGVIRKRAEMSARGFEPVMAAQPVGPEKSEGEGNRA
jgi:hypothetical protein